MTKRTLDCLRCGAPMACIRVERMSPNNLLLGQLQRIADHAGLRVLQCTHCGKLEFFRPGKVQTGETT